MRYLKLLLLVVFLGGCATASYTGRKQETFARFSDIPVISGSKFMHKNSFVFENNNQRIALLKYETPLPPEKAVAFFKKEMPLKGWALIDILESGTNILSFKSNKELCTISIFPRIAGSSVVVKISPFEKEQ